MSRATSKRIFNEAKLRNMAKFEFLYPIAPFEEWVRSKIMIKDL